ncbi:MAG TPA: sulfite exporter TauE/SafE family protein [Longimicrobiaceae bacterium]|nr:sulfite exporter TauE/SafE family protein [Longimicrobiaceae bacterium]
MTLAAVLAALGVGIVAGLLSGLIGIGGGVLIVPFLYFFYAHPALFGHPVSAGLATVVAHATSLFAIVPTAIRGTQAFHRSDLVVWPAVWPIGLASTVAAVAAAGVADRLPPQMLRVGFGVLLVFSGYRLLRQRNQAEGEVPHGSDHLRLTLPVTIGTGLVVGTFSALLGVGGGIVAIPLLMNVVGIDVRRVAGTSMGIIAITSVAGVLAYVVGGIGEPGRPPLSLGYVDVAAGMAIFLGALLSVPWGAKLNQRMNPRGLALLFGTFLVLMGLRLVLENLGAL